MVLDLSRRAVKFLTHLPPKQFRQVVSKILSLLSDPEPPDSQWLTGHSWRRTDVGEYRVVYRLEGGVLKVAIVGKRNDDEVYRELDRLQ
jgi:mRNA interferase RelE/StbE